MRHTGIPCISQHDNGRYQERRAHAALVRGLLEVVGQFRFRGALFVTRTISWEPD